MTQEKTKWFSFSRDMKLIAKLYVQELHLHGNSIGDEGIRALMSGLSSRKGLRFTAVIDILS